MLTLRSTANVLVISATEDWKIVTDLTGHWEASRIRASEEVAMVEVTVRSKTGGPQGGRFYEPGPHGSSESCCASELRTGAVRVGYSEIRTLSAGSVAPALRAGARGTHGRVQ